MNNNSPYLVFLDILKKCRSQMIDDILKDNSIDLYDALYSNVNSEIYNIKIELYELEWMKLHWKMIINRIEQKKISIFEKEEWEIMFDKWYQEFVSKWNYSELDIILFENMSQILKTLISLNNGWEGNIKKIEVLFEKNKKLLNAKLQKLKTKE